MKMGDYVVYVGAGRKPKLGRWITITKNHRAIIRCVQSGNEAIVTRSINSIVSVNDLMDKVNSFENRRKL